MDIIDAWKKAAVEHRIIELEYYGKTKRIETIRNVEPDYYGFAKNGRTKLLWTTYDHLRKTGPRSFLPTNVRSFKATNETFHPSNPTGRWREHLQEYHERDLKNRDFNERS